MAVHAGLNGGMDLPLLNSEISRSPPFSVMHPPRQAGPVVFASPHSGRDYPAALLAETRLDAVALRRSEDCFVDELFDAAPRHGAPLLAAHFPRAWCDVNREQWELDPGMFEEALPGFVNIGSARVGAGLGTIPRVVTSGEAIYRRKLRFAEAEERMRQCWSPYHDALAGLIRSTRETFGACLLIDCHSMPGLVRAAAGQGRAMGLAAPDFVLGDAHGTACAPRITAHVEAALAGLGYTVRRNDPYAGGYVTRHYGRPRKDVHVLQIEIARPLYMNEQDLRRSAGFEGLRGQMAVLIETLVREAPGLLAP